VSRLEPVQAGVYNRAVIYTLREGHAMRSGRALARKNLIVDEQQVRALKRVLKVSTESEAVRIAVRDRLALEEAQAALRRIRARRGVEDIFRRSVPDLRESAG
jgi:hypothetical protein